MGTVAAGMAGGIAGDSAGSTVAGTQAGRNSVENNELFNLPSGLNSYSNSASTPGMSMSDTGATAQQINAAMSKNVKGDMPEGANITKVIISGYKDGVLIAGAWYLGPAASIGKVVGGAVIAEIANGTYQWFDINSVNNQSCLKISKKPGIIGAALRQVLREHWLRGEIYGKTQESRQVEPYLLMGLIKVL